MPISKALSQAFGYRCIVIDTLFEVPQVVAAHAYGCPSAALESNIDTIQRAEVLERGFATELGH